jgi:uncharacterized protein YbjT (DUF2867 family)
MKTAIVIGSTGLVGSALVELLSQNKGYSTIYSISRNKPPNLPEKVTHIPFNSGNYAIPPDCDVAFCALGTTRKKAGSKEAFLKVDLDMVLAFATKSIDAGVTRIAVVSSIGADSDASNFYLKTKGQAEEELKSIGFERLVIVRPSLLLGKRSERRFGEDVGKALDAVLKFILVGRLRKYRGIQATDVAKAMIRLAETGNGTSIIESDKLFGIARSY